MTLTGVINEKKFYDHIRSKLFGGKISAEQFEGIDLILREYALRCVGDLRKLAYILATTYHETARTMQPIKEYGGSSYFHRMYDIGGDRPKVARDLGNLTPGDGVKYFGRGYVQITGRANYARFSQLLGLALINNPDLALRPDVAVKILFMGSLSGLFTGKKLSDYINESETDYVGARWVINRQDKAKQIAGYAEEFYKGLIAA